MKTTHFCYTNINILVEVRTRRIIIHGQINDRKNKVGFSNNLPKPSPPSQSVKVTSASPNHCHARDDSCLATEFYP